MMVGSEQLSQEFHGEKSAGAKGERVLGTVGAFEAAGAALPAGRPMDLYGDGRAAERIVDLLAAGAG